MHVASMQSLYGFLPCLHCSMSVGPRDCIGQRQAHSAAIVSGLSAGRGEWMGMVGGVSGGGCSPASLASLVQEVMNAAPGVARTAGELELAMAMVTRAKLLEEQSLTIDWDVVQAEVAATVPDASPQTVASCGLFCRFYGAGSEAPLLKFLHDFSLKYGASKRLGEEFMSTVVGLRFAGQERSHAFARAAMIATNLTATKVVDGVARLLSKSDGRFGEGLGRASCSCLVSHEECDGIECTCQGS